MLNSRLHQHAFLFILVAFTSTTGTLSQSSVKPIEPLSGLSRSLESLAQRVGQATVQIFSLRYAPQSRQVTSGFGVLTEEREDLNRGLADALRQGLEVLRSSCWFTVVRAGNLLLHR